MYFIYIRHLSTFSEKLLSQYQAKLSWHTFSIDGPHSELYLIIIFGFGANPISKMAPTAGHSWLTVMEYLSQMTTEMFHLL